MKSTKLLNGNLINIEEDLIYKTNSNQYIKIFKINGRTACRFLNSEEIKYYQEKQINPIIFDSTIKRAVYSKIRKKMLNHTIYY